MYLDLGRGMYIIEENVVAHMAPKQIQTNLFGRMTSERDVCSLKFNIGSLPWAEEGDVFPPVIGFAPHLDIKVNIKVDISSMILMLFS